MKIIYNINDFKNDNKIHLAIGNFDGVHNGHKAVIKNALSKAKLNDSEAWVLTFNPHPLEIINPEIKPSRISTLDQQLSIFKSLDINGVIVMKFNKELMNLSPINFLNLLANNISKLSGIYVGDDWSFGKNKSGDKTLLKEFCSEKKIIFSRQKEIIFQDKKISSSRIRKLIQKGEIKKVNLMLGYNFKISGLVVHGKKIGRTLGYPTANIKTENECIPLNGIYAGICYLNNKPYSIALYIGTNETIDDNNQIVIEAHFINEKNLNLYGKIIEIEVIDFLRKDKKFENTEDLQKQIKSDILKIKKILK